MRETMVGHKETYTHKHAHTLRQGETERDRERERQREKQTERQTERQTHTHR